MIRIFFLFFSVFSRCTSHKRLWGVFKRLKNSFKCGLNVQVVRQLLTRGRSGPVGLSGLSQNAGEQQAKRIGGGTRHTVFCFHISIAHESKIPLALEPIPHVVTSESQECSYKRPECLPRPELSREQGVWQKGFSSWERLPLSVLLPLRSSENLCLLLRL